MSQGSAKDLAGNTTQQAATMGRFHAGLLWLAAISWAVSLLIGSFLFGKGFLGLAVHALGIRFEIAAAALGVWLGLLVIWWARRQGKLDPFEFPIWFSLNAYVQIVLNVWLLQRNSTVRSPWAAGDPGRWAVQVVLLLAVGLTALWAAYIWVRRRPRHQPSLSQSAARAPRLKVVVSVWLVTWLIMTVSVLAGARGYLGGASGFVGGYYLLLVEVLGNLAMFVLMLLHFRHPTRLGQLWLLLACGSSIAAGLIIGSKSAVFVLLYVVMAAYYSRGRLPKKWLVAGILVVIATVPIVNAFRTNLFGAGYSRLGGASFSERLPILVDSVRGAITQPVATLVGETRSTLELRQRSVFDFSAAALAVHPAVRPYVGSDMLLLIAQQSIPRFLWPGKPVARPELYNLSTAYMGLAEETSFTASGQFGDVYRTGGWPFVIFWFLGLGALSAWLYRQGPAVGELAGTAFYLTMLTGVLSYDEGVLLVTKGVLEIGILVWILAMYVMFQRLPKEPSPGSGSGEGPWHE
jgi:hypothetical protein